jgi:hypothetical protein
MILFSVGQKAIHFGNRKRFFNFKLSNFLLLNSKLYFNFSDFIFDRKYILRHRIDTLKEYTRIQLYLIREEQRTSIGNKECFSNKFKQLMKNFDSEKRKIKSELLENFDKVIAFKFFKIIFSSQL